jgi:hypothetical protein
MRQSINPAMDCARALYRERPSSLKLFSKLLDGVCLPQKDKEGDVFSGAVDSPQDFMAKCYLYAQAVKKIAGVHTTYGVEHLPDLMREKIIKIGVHVAQTDYADRRLCG